MPGPSRRVSPRLRRRPLQGAEAQVSSGSEEKVTRRRTRSSRRIAGEDPEKDTEDGDSSPSPRRKRQKTDDSVRLGLSRARDEPSSGRKKETRAMESAVEDQDFSDSTDLQRDSSRRALMSKIFTHLNTSFRWEDHFESLAANLRSVKLPQIVSARSGEQRTIAAFIGSSLGSFMPSDLVLFSSLSLNVRMFCCLEWNSSNCVPW